MAGDVRERREGEGHDGEEGDARGNGRGRSVGRESEKDTVAAAMHYIVETHLEVGSVNPASMQNRENPFIWW